MKIAAYLLIAFGLVWLARIAWTLVYGGFFGGGIILPDWVPQRIIEVLAVLLPYVTLLGWVAPISAGAWILVKRS